MAPVQSLGALTLPEGRPPQGPELSSPQSPARASSAAPQPRHSLAPEGCPAGTVRTSRRVAQGADAGTVRCAPTLGEALLLTAPPSAWGTTGSYSKATVPVAHSSQALGPPSPTPGSSGSERSRNLPKVIQQASDRQGQASALTLRGPLRTPRVPQPQPRLRRNARARAGPGARDADGGASSPGASQNPLSSHAPRLRHHPLTLPPPWGALRGHGTRCLL